jgi:hypothetical protein
MTARGMLFALDQLNPTMRAQAEEKMKELGARPTPRSARHRAGPGRAEGRRVEETPRKKNSAPLLPQLRKNPKARLRSIYAPRGSVTSSSSTSFIRFGSGASTRIRRREAGDRDRRRDTGRGRHQRIAGFRNDIKKYNELTVMGWRLLRFMPEMVSSGIRSPHIKRALEGGATRRRGKRCWQCTRRRSASTRPNEDREPRRRSCSKLEARARLMALADKRPASSCRPSSASSAGCANICWNGSVSRSVPAAPRRAGLRQLPRRRRSRRHYRIGMAGTLRQVGDGDHRARDRGPAEAARRRGDAGRAAGAPAERVDPGEGLPARAAAEAHPGRGRERMADRAEAVMVGIVKVYGLPLHGHARAAPRDLSQDRRWRARALRPAAERVLSGMRHRDREAARRVHRAVRHETAASRGSKRTCTTPASKR